MTALAAFAHDAYVDATGATGETELLLSRRRAARRRNRRWPMPTEDGGRDIADQTAVDPDVAGEVADDFADDLTDPDALSWLPPFCDGDGGRSLMDEWEAKADARAALVAAVVAASEDGTIVGSVAGSRRARLRLRRGWRPLACALAGFCAGILAAGVALTT